MLKTACFIFSLPLWRWFTVHLWKRPATLQLLLCYTFSLISSSLHSMLLCFIAVHFINQNTFTSFYAIMPKLHICQDRKLRNKKFHFLVRTNKRFPFKINLFQVRSNYDFGTNTKGGDANVDTKSALPSYLTKALIT